MKTPAERGPDGNWLVAAREARGFRSAAAAREAIRKATGVDIAHSAYAGYESGSKRISANHRPVLVQFWGEPDATPAAAQSTDMAAILELLRLQTEELKSAWEAIHYLADTIRETRVAPDEMAEVVVRVMEAREKQRAQQARVARVPRGSSGPRGSASPRPDRSRDGQESVR